jgi:hypothetical protein
MANNNHPITPPEDLLRQWCTYRNTHKTSDKFWRHIAIEAARWGADMELEACVEWLAFPEDKEKLRADRRPKPPSLQDQALDDLERIAALLMENKLPCDTGNIRRALESLPN